MKTLNVLVDATLVIEKLRVASEIRQSHLALQNKHDPETDELHSRIKGLEDYVDGRIAVLLKAHPAYSWFCRVKGIGRENIGKIVGLVRVEAEQDDEGTELPFASTISGLWKFCGYGVENGHGEKRTAGEKLSYNSQLRSMCWRLGGSLLKAGLRKKCSICGALLGEQGIEKHKCSNAKFSIVGTSNFARYYLTQKESYNQRYLNSGWQIVPATQLPKKNGKKVEGEGFISEGHIHNMALRKMIKLFLACLWLSWREGLGLPVTAPYAIAKLGHDSFIKPEDMVDR